jgi:TRAP-type C4-dicarboxylate transport system permease small subunit
MTKALSRIEQALIWCAVAATAAMMLLTSADALLRYTVNKPIVGAYEVTEKYLMVAAIFLGFSYAYRGGAFIRVTFLVDMLPKSWRLAADYLAYLVSLACCVVFFVATAGQAMRELADTTTLATLPILTGPAYALVPIGFLALLVLMLADVRRIRTGNTLLFSQEAPSA